MIFDYHSLTRRVKYRISTALSTYPTVYYGIRQITGMMDDRCVKSDTELVIEGYPRSANSTTVASFQACQTRIVKIAHHKHSVAQVLLAIRRDIPAVVLIRNPKDTIISYVSLIQESQIRNGSKKGEITFFDALLGWNVFYRVLESHTDKFVIAPFHKVIQDISGTIRAINKKFGTDFQEEPLTEPLDKPLGWHAKPNELRNHIKQALEEEFAKTLLESRELKQSFNEAYSRYQLFMDLYDRCY